MGPELSVEAEEVFAQAAVGRGLLMPDELRQLERVARSCRERGAPKPLHDLAVQLQYLTQHQQSLLLDAILSPDGLPMVGPYLILQKLGQGRAGTVYKARDAGSGRVVAVRLLPVGTGLDEEYTHCFIKEAQAVAELDHPHLVQVLDAGESDGIYYLAMDLAKGSSLAAVLGEGKVFAEHEAIDIIYQIAEAQEYYCARGMVHGAIRPSSIVVEEGVARLNDLALPRREHDTEATGGEPAAEGPGSESMESLAYVAPEQLRGDSEVDIRSDVYSLGAVLFQMVAGSPPFSAQSAAEILAAHDRGEPPSPGHVKHAVSDGLCRLIGKMMASRPEDRFVDPTALLTALDLLRRGESSPADAESAEPHPARALPTQMDREKIGSDQVTAMAPESEREVEPEQETPEPAIEDEMPTRPEAPEPEARGEGPSPGLLPEEGFSVPGDDEPEEEEEPLADRPTVQVDGVLPSEDHEQDSAVPADHESRPEQPPPEEKGSDFYLVIDDEGVLLESTGSGPAVPLASRRIPTEVKGEAPPAETPGEHADRAEEAGELTPPLAAPPPPSEPPRPYQPSPPPPAYQAPTPYPAPVQAKSQEMAAGPAVMAPPKKRRRRGLALLIVLLLGGGAAAVAWQNGYDFRHFRPIRDLLGRLGGIGRRVSARLGEIRSSLDALRAAPYPDRQRRLPEIRKELLVLRSGPDAAAVSEADRTQVEALYRRLADIELEHARSAPPGASGQEANRAAIEALRKVAAQYPGTDAASQAREGAASRCVQAFEQSLNAAKAAEKREDWRTASRAYRDAGDMAPDEKKPAMREYASRAESRALVQDAENLVGDGTPRPDAIRRAQGLLRDALRADPDNKGARDLVHRLDVFVRSSRILRDALERVLAAPPGEARSRALVELERALKAEGSKGLESARALLGSRAAPPGLLALLAGLGDVASVQSLVSGLREADAARRALHVAAVVSLLKDDASRPACLSAMQAALEDEAAHTGLGEVWRLWEKADPGAVGRLVDVLGTESGRARIEGAKGILAALDPRSVLPRIRPLLKSTDLRVFRDAVDVTVNLGEPANADMVYLLREDIPAVRAKAGAALAKIGVPAVPLLVRASANIAPNGLALIRGATASRLRLCHQDALRAIKSIGAAAVPELLKDADADDERVADAARAILLATLGEEALKYIGEQAANADGPTRTRFVCILLEMKPDQAGPLLRQILKQGDGRAPALRALVKKSPDTAAGRQRAAHLVVPLIADADREVQAAARQALSQLGEEGLDVLLAQLADANADPNTRQAAREALAQLDERAVQSIVMRLSSPVQEKRTRARLALNSLGPSACPAFLNLLEKATDQEARQAAQDYIVRAGKEALPHLEKALTGTRDAAFGSTVVRLVSRIGGQDAARILVGNLATAPAPIRQTIAQALEGMGQEAEGELLKSAAHADARVRADSIALLGARPLTGRSVVAMVSATHDEAADVRRAATGALEKQGHALLPYLRPMLIGPDVEARRDGVAWLVKVGSTGSAADLAAACTDQDAGVRCAALLGLEKVDPKGAATHAVTMLKDADDQVRADSIDVLARSATASIREELRTYVLRARDRRTRTAVAEALCRMKYPGAIPVLLAVAKATRSPEIVVMLCESRMRQAVPGIVEMVLDRKLDDRSRATICKALGRMVGQDLGTDVKQWKRWWRSHRKEYPRPPER